MRAMRRRLQSLEARLGPPAPRLPPKPASVRWGYVLRILKGFLNEDDAEVARVSERMRRSISFLEDYAAHHLPKHPNRQIERFCEECMERFPRTVGNWEQHHLAFLDAGYDERMRELGMDTNEIPTSGASEPSDTWLIPERTELP
jgi:hypothetical protein